MHSKEEINVIKNNPFFLLPFIGACFQHAPFLDALGSASKRGGFVSLMSERMLSYSPPCVQSQCKANNIKLNIGIVVVADCLALAGCMATSYIFPLNHSSSLSTANAAPESPSYHEGTIYITWVEQFHLQHKHSLFFSPCHHNRKKKYYAAL